MNGVQPAGTRPDRLETDYLIVGAGAMGMAFTDVITTHRPDAHITLVDRHARPGGHWNDAYPFVALHQPAAFYGLNSAQLGSGGSDLASGPEILSYYHRAMQRYIASGQVTFLPMSDYQDDNTVVSTVDPSCVTRVAVRQRLVDASYMHITVPSTRAPRYKVQDSVALVPLNELPRITRPWQRYVVIGGGKTGMDAVLFLLANGVATNRIQWIIPNDSWLWDRARVQPGLATGELLGQLETIIQHRNVDEFFLALEQRGSVHRIDNDVMPKKWRCATVNRAEVAALRTVENVVRLGRVQEINPDEICLDGGRLPTNANTLHVDCTADGLTNRPPRPLFEPGRVTLQSLVMCQQVFSAAILGRLLLLDKDDDALNAICKPVPHPEYSEDMPGCVAASFENMVSANRHIPLWLRRCRLNLMHHDSLFNYVAGALKARRILPAALAAIDEAKLRVA